MTTTAAAAGPFPSDTTSSSSSVAAYPVTATTPPTPPPPPPPPSTPAQEHQHQHQHQPPAASDCSHTAAADTPRAMNAPPAASVVVAEGPPPPPPPPPPHPTPSNPIVTDAMPSALSSPPPLLISFAAASRAPPASSPSPLHDSSRPGVGAHISDGACSASHEAGATAPAVDDVGVIADGHTIEPAAEEPMEPEQPEQQLEQEPDQQHQQQPEQPQRAPQPAQRRPRNDQNPAVRSLLAFKLLFTFCIGIPNIALVASGIALFAVVPAAVPSYVCEPSLRINLLIDLAISVALAIAWIYAIALLRERSRPLARAISFAGLSKLSLNLLQLGVVFPRDGSVCKVEDKVVWMVAAFRLCLFFGCAVGVLNSMLADMVGPKPFRQNDPYFVHLFWYSYYPRSHRPSLTSCKIQVY
ncbi:hypothetical protein DFJ73DRAFT_58517 [Zopfochytrium polystomum]|nr:hypothetical protein DFJ73DRAFT_58517 [Zopfochytrium polystomum]